MNNNGFSLLRYFIDLNLDADLLLFRDDGIGNSSHFSIKNDTWEYSKWSDHVVNLPAVNSYGQALSIFTIPKIILYISYILRSLFSSSNAIYTKPAKKEDIIKLKDILQRYDLIIGSGATPAILESIGLKLNVFFAYSVGIEYYEEEYFKHYRTSSNPVIKFISNKMAILQEKGIKRADLSLNTEFTYTKDAFARIGVETKPLHLPIVYPFEKSKKSEFSQELKTAIEEIESNRDSFVLISHARHMWVKPKIFGTRNWPFSKHNNFMFMGFKDFLEKRPSANAIFITFEYGEDVNASKELSQKLGIESNIRWLPIMPRKEILELIGKSSVGLGEIHDQDIMWGGTGWEILSKGKPLIQSFSKNKRQFVNEYGYPPPQILSAQTPESITQHLIDLYDKRKEINAGMSENLAWFKEYNSHNAIKEILNSFISEKEG